MVLTILITTFIVSVFGFAVANAWTMVANQMFKKYSTKNAEGIIVYPTDQMVIYALSLTIFCIGLLWYLHTYKYIDISHAR